MKLKDVLSDRLFLTLTWLHILGSISQGITVFILLVVLLGLSETFASFVSVLLLETRQMVTWSIALVLLINIGFLFINWGVMQYYQSAPSVGSVGSKSSLREVSKMRSKEEKEIQKFFLFVGPSVIFVMVILHFILLVLTGEGGKEALQASILFILPFAVAFAVAHFSRIILEMVILFLRYSFRYREFS
jgi:hypothetical protein